MGIKNQQKKATLAKKGRQTKWAPFWAVIKKFGMGKRVHPSQMTRHRRSWRRTKIKAGPRKIRRDHFG
jgi:ribosomal protein L39E